jgi:hypothetical protein
MDDNMLNLFRFFDKLKDVTTKSYSLKKLQDLLETRLAKDKPVDDLEYIRFVEQFKEDNDLLKERIEIVESFINKLNP